MPRVSRRWRPGKHFGVFLTTVDPDLTTVRGLDRRRRIEPWLTSLSDTVSEKDGQPISIGDRNRRVVAVMTFLTEITEWGWDATRPASSCSATTSPSPPQVLPRYLPVDADRRLTAELTEHPDNELAALAPRLQRACCLRIGELLDSGAGLRARDRRQRRLAQGPAREDGHRADGSARYRDPRPDRPDPIPRPTDAAPRFLFTYLGRRLTQQCIRRELDHAADIAGLEHITSHQLRHT